MSELGSEFSYYSTITSISDGTINLIQFVLAGCTFHMAKEGKKVARKERGEKKEVRGIKALSRANLDAFH